MYHAKSRLNTPVWGSLRSPYYIPPPFTVHFSMREISAHIIHLILHTLYYTLRTEHAYCLSYRFLNNVVITTVIEMVEMVEMVELLDARLGKCSVERVRYALGHCEIWRHFTRTLYFHSPSARDNTVVTILSLLVKYLVISHADPCNKSYNYIEPKVRIFSEAEGRGKYSLPRV